jgi:hypothetical protein
MKKQHTSDKNQFDYDHKNFFILTLEEFLNIFEDFIVVQGAEY